MYLLLHLLGESEDVGPDEAIHSVTAKYSTYETRSWGEKFVYIVPYDSIDSNGIEPAWGSLKFFHNFLWITVRELEDRINSSNSEYDKITLTDIERMKQAEAAVSQPHSVPHVTSE